MDVVGWTVVMAAAVVAEAIVLRPWQKQKGQPSVSRAHTETAPALQRQVRTAGQATVLVLVATAPRVVAAAVVTAAAVVGRVVERVGASELVVATVSTAVLLRQ